MKQKVVMTNQPVGTVDFKQPYSEIKEHLVQESLRHIVKDRLENYETGKLDQSILDACIESVFFLGKLKDLNSIVTDGRDDINQALSQYTEVIEKELLQQSAKKSNKFSIFLKKELGGIINKYVDKLKRKGAKEFPPQELHENNQSNNFLKKEREQIVNRYMSRFAGKRFLEEMKRGYNERLKIPTHEHFMTVMTRQVSDKLMSLKGQEINDVKRLRSVATLFFDLDGLKMLNDMSLGGYDSGDKALWVMARALTNKNLQIWAENLGIELVPAHRSGDEFLLGIVAEGDVDLADSSVTFKGVNGEEVGKISLAKYIGDYIKTTVQNFGQENSNNNVSKDEVTASEIQDDESERNKKNQIKIPQSMGDIIDFANKEQRYKFEEEVNKMPKELQSLFNENFVYQLSCSYGYMVKVAMKVASNFNRKFKFFNNNFFSA